MRFKDWLLEFGQPMLGLQQDDLSDVKKAAQNAVRTKTSAAGAIQQVVSKQLSDPKPTDPKKLGKLAKLSDTINDNEPKRPGVV